MLQGLGAGLLLLAIFWSLINCFLGYVIFRISLVVMSAVTGGVGGAMLVAFLRPGASGLDCLVGGTGLAVVAVFVAWFLWRPVFAAHLGLSVLLLCVRAALGSPIGWVLGVLLCVGVAVAAYIFARPLIIFAYALGGALGAVFLTTLLVGADPDALASGPEPRIGILVLLLGISVLLTAAGVVVQVRMNRLIRSPFTPPIERKGKGKRRRPGGRVQPGFSRV